MSNNGRTATAARKEEVKVPGTYGTDLVYFLLKSGDYGWNMPDKNHKKVLLVNPKDCERKITLMGLVKAWRGTGHSEWEAILANWFIVAVVTAIDEDTEADLTNMFNRDFLASRDRVFTKQQVFDHLIKWFEIVSEDDETLELRFKI